MDKTDNILITGSGGMVGKALVKRLKGEGYKKILTPNSKELDLRKQRDVEDYFQKNKPDIVFHLAAKVGGIAANIKFPGEFLYDNLIMTANVTEAARQNNVKKLLFLGSSCIYPRESKQPMKEEYLLSGKLEPTNEGYAIGKICGLKLCEYYNKQYGTEFISIMPPNLYGEGDHFNSEKSHVISALISKFHKAKTNNEKKVEVWGTGNVRREFLYVGDIVEAVIFFINNSEKIKDTPFVNVGAGEDVSIKELSFLIKDIIGYEGEIFFDTTKPEGMPKKLMESSLAKKLGWEPRTTLKEGIEKTYQYFKNSIKDE
jgi:GDP-L-fucose synthase